jgi:hypothetical protein
VAGSATFQVAWRVFTLHIEEMKDTWLLQNEAVYSRACQSLIDSWVTLTTPFQLHRLYRVKWGGKTAMYDENLRTWKVKPVLSCQVSGENEESWKPSLNSADNLAEIQTGYLRNTSVRRYLLGISRVIKLVLDRLFEIYMTTWKFIDICLRFQVWWRFRLGDIR